MHAGERKMLYDILAAGETIEGMLAGTFRQDTDRLHRHRGVVVATSKQVIFADKGVFGSSEVMMISYESIESVTHSTGMFRAGIQIKGKGASSYRIEDIGRKSGCAPVRCQGAGAHRGACQRANSITCGCGPKPCGRTGTPSGADGQGHPHRRRVRSKEETATGAVTR